MAYPLTTELGVRRIFWASYGAAFARRPGWAQNQYPADVRAAWVDFVDLLAREGQISESLASRVTL